MGQQLIGRAAELVRLQHYVVSGGRVIVVFGEQGVGKTRLAREMLSYLGKLGHQSHHLSANAASATIPFVALMDLLPPVSVAAADATSLIRTGVQYVQEQLVSRPMAVLVDDAHLLDAGSLALMSKLVRLDGFRLILTVRSHHPVPDEVTALWKDEIGIRVELQALSRRDTAALVTHHLGASAERSANELLWTMSRGNPLILREIVQAARTQGSLVRKGSTWCLTKRPLPSSRLIDLVTVRLAGLPPASRFGLEALALVEPLSYARFEALLGDDAIEVLETANAVEVVRSGRRHELRYALPIDREVLRATTPHARRAQVARALLDVFSLHPSSRRGEGLRLVALRDIAGHPPSVEELLCAAREALALAHHAEAERLAATALGRGGGFEAQLTRGEALTYQLQATEAEAELTAALAQARDDSDRAQVALLRSHNLMFNLGDPAAAGRVLNDARSQVTDSGWHDEIDAAHALITMLVGDLRGALRAGQEVRDRPGADGRALLRVLIVSTVAHTMLGDLTDARADLARAKPLLPPLSDMLPLAAEQIGITEILALWHGAQVRQATELALERRALHLETGPPDPAGTWATAAAITSLETGHVEDAAALADEAIDRCREADPLGLRGTALAIRARCAAALGDAATASQLLQVLARDGNPADARAGVHADRAQVWLTAANGMVDEACELAVEMGQRAIAADYVVWGAATLHDSVRYGRPALVVDVLNALSADHDAELLSLLAEHGRALAASDAAALTEVADRFEDGGMMLYAAEAATQAADACARAGNSSGCQASLASAARLLAGSGAVMTPAIVRTDGSLTTRERQVALMASGGLTSRQIADRLTVSVRTVDNHLARIYRKTGVRGRHELVTILRPVVGAPAATLDRQHVS